MGRIKDIISEEIERLRNIQAGRWSDNIFGSLLNVGENKPVGYLPLSTIAQYGDKNALHDLIHWASSMNYKSEIIKNGSTDSGALYIWDANTLTNFLTKYKTILINAGIPTTPDEYVNYIEHYTVSNSQFPDAYAVVGKSFNDSRFTDELPSMKNTLNESTYKVYHGSNNKFSNFNFKEATQGVVWFTDNIDTIKKGEHGGMGNKYIMTRYITINKPAGWDEYEKYSLWEIQNMGFDGIILPDGDETTYVVFSPKSIRANPPISEDYPLPDDASTSPLPQYGDRLPSIS